MWIKIVVDVVDVLSILYLQLLYIRSCTYEASSVSQQAHSLQFVHLRLMTWESRGWWFQSLGLCKCVGDAEEAPDAWLQIHPARAVMAIWWVSQWMKDLHQFLLCQICLSNKYKINLKKKKKWNTSKKKF